MSALAAVAAHTARAVPSTVEALRERIRQMEAAPRFSQLTMSTGIEVFDALLQGGFPAGTVIELMGSPASGKTSLALKVVAQATRQRRLCAYIDTAKQLYAPAAQGLGVDLKAVLVLRPKLASQAVWAALQLLRSGCFAVTVLDIAHVPALSFTEIKKLTDAVAKSQTVLLVLTAPATRPTGALQFEVKAQGVDTIAIECLRSRKGHVAVLPLPLSTLTVPPAILRPRAPNAMLVCQAKPTVQQRAFSRPQKGLERNGQQGVYGQRPGRDVTMPSLFGAPSLGG
jgi:recombination protein RecA